MSAALSVVLVFTASMAFAQQAGDDPVRQAADEKVRAEFRKVLGDAKEKGQQDIEALAKTMDPDQRTAARGELEKLAAETTDPAAKAQIAKAMTALARQASGQEAVDLARKAREIAPTDAAVRSLTEPVLRMARDPSAGGDRPAPPVQTANSLHRAIMNKAYDVSVKDSRTGRQVADRLSGERVELREDRTGRLKDSIVDAAWDNGRLVVSIDSTALEQNKNTPATLAPLVAKALDNGDFIKQHGDGVVSRVEMALRGWFTTGQVGDQIMAKGENRIDTQNSSAGRTVGFFVDLFRGKMTQESYTPQLGPALTGAKLNITLKRDVVERFAAIAEFQEGGTDRASGAAGDKSYYPSLNATKTRLRQQ